jgi:hypothetical protein
LNDHTNIGDERGDVSTIVNARFQQQSEADSAVQTLNTSGFESRYIATFFVSAPGQHAMHPLGGDEEASPGTEDSPTTAAAGAAVGSVAGAITGVATLPVLGPAAAAAAVGVGAWVGSLYGALGGTDAKDTTEQATGSAITNADDERQVRKSGMLVAVAVRNSQQQRDAIALFERCGGMDIELCTGTISKGEWRDFNPIRPLNLIELNHSANSD